MDSQDELFPTQRLDDSLDLAADSGSSLKGSSVMSDSGFGSAPSSQLTEISGGDFQQSHFGDQIHNWTKNDSSQTNYQTTNIESQHLHIHCDGGPETKKTRIGGEDECSKPCTGELQFCNSISADTTKSLHKNKKIYRGEKKTATRPIPVAVKLLDFSAMSEKEVDNLQNVDRHPNVVRIYDSNIHLEGQIKYIYIAMELCDRETLCEYVKRQGSSYDEQLAIKHCSQLISGLKYIHDQGICHHDVKPHNMLFALEEDGSVCHDELKMTDFGFSRRFQTDASVTQSTNQGAGTRGYMAPEVLDLRERNEHKDREEIKEASRKITKKIDVFSLGLVLCFCLSKGSHPYGRNTIKQDHSILEGEKPDFSGIHLNNKKMEIKIKNLLSGMLQHSPDDRPTMEEVSKEWQKLLEAEGRDGELVQDELLAKPAPHYPKAKEDSQGDEEEINCKAPTPSIALFEKSSWKMCSIYSLQPGHEEEEVEVAPIVSSVSLSQTYTTVAMGRKLYALTWMKYVFVLNIDNVVAGWSRVDSTDFLHGKYPPAAVFKDKIYVCGGGWEWSGMYRKTRESFPLASDVCEVYDPSEGVFWLETAYMQEERRYNTVIALGEYLFSIGGKNASHEDLLSVERFNPGSETWEFVADLNKPRCHAAASTLGNTIYVLGGEGEQSIEAYNPVAGIWTVLPFKLSVDGSSLSAVTLSGKLYAVGRSDVDLVDLDANECKRWHKIKLMVNEMVAVALTE